MNTKVAVGPTTVLGAGVGTSAFAAAALAFILGDHSEQVLGVIAGGIIGTVITGVVLVGRYVQAKTLAAKAAVQVPSVWTSSTSGSTGNVTITPAPDSLSSATADDVFGEVKPADPADIPADAGQAEVQS